MVANIEPTRRRSSGVSALASRTTYPRIPDRAAGPVCARLSPWLYGTDFIELSPLPALAEGALMEPPPAAADGVGVRGCRAEDPRRPRTASAQVGHSPTIGK